MTLGPVDMCVIAEPADLLCSRDGGSFEPLELPGPVMQATLGDGFGCAIIDGGDVHCWGRGDLGQLGLGFVPAEPVAPQDTTPVPLPEPAAMLDTSGGEFVCAVLRDSSVYCWGRNVEDCGDGSDTCRPIPVSGFLGYPIGEHVGDDESPLDVGPVRVFE